MNPARPARWRELPGWLPVWLLVAGVSIFLHGPLPLFSTRTLTVAWEMWDLGEWLLPHQNGAPYSHKAPLLYWLFHAGWFAFGVGETWPRLVILALGTLNLWLLAQLGRQLYPGRPQVAALAPWLLAGSLFYFLYALQIMFDLLVSACALGTLVALTRRDAHGVSAPHFVGAAAALALGLLAKGPVALLHVVFPLLLGPLWLDAARARPGWWYGRVLGVVLGAGAVFALWLVPAALAGGEEYRRELLFLQTQGRLVRAFDHARPVWWYFAVLPVLLYPWLYWGATWRAAHRRGQWAEPGTRLLLLWLVPSLAAFSLISGKQAYYLMPQLAGFALWLAAALGAADAGGARPVRPLGGALALIALGALFAALPWIAAHAIRDSAVPQALAQAGSGYGLVVVALGTVLLQPAPGHAAAARRLALAGLLATAILHLQFTRSAWPRYDLAPAAAVLAEHARAGHLLARVGRYEGEFHFLGRLTTPIVEVDYNSGQEFATRHPDALMIDTVQPEDIRPFAPEGPRPIHVAPFRSEQLELWLARDWLRWRQSLATRAPADGAVHHDGALPATPRTKAVQPAPAANREIAAGG